MVEYKVWIEIERVDEEADTYKQAAEPELLGEFFSEEAAVEFRDLVVEHAMSHEFSQAVSERTQERIKYHNRARAHALRAGAIGHGHLFSQKIERGLSSTSPVSRISERAQERLAAQFRPGSSRKRKKESHQ